MRDREGVLLVKGAPFTIPEVPGSELENLIYYNQLHKGGHFAAWEQPQLFSREVRLGLRSLRK